MLCAMPRQVDHEERRREIIYSVWRLITTAGIEGVTFRHVAAKAGISLGQVQHYFADKNDLVRCGCEEIVRVARARFEAASSGKEARERLRALLHQPIPATPGLRAGTIVWSAYRTKSLDDPEIARLIRSAEEHRRDVAEQLLGEFAVSPTRPAARRLLALADGLAIRVLVGLLPAEEALAILDTEVDALPSQGALPSR